MKEELIQYGLSEREAEIFLICLKTGKATANRIAELANMARSTVYDILERLKAHGLITTNVIDNKINFIASDPNVLLTSLDEKKQSIQQILPSLKEIHNKVGERPFAEVYQGKIAIIKLLDEILDNAKELKIIGSQGNALEKIGYHPTKFRMKRTSKKIILKQILELSKEAKKEVSDDYTETRFLESLKDSKEAIFIFDDYVYHIILQYEISAIKIKSKDHARAMNIMFDEMWAKSKP